MGVPDLIENVKKRNLFNRLVLDGTAAVRNRV
jgi:hypothetical protein